MNALARRGFGEAKRVARQHAKSFYFASFLLFGKRRGAAFALYAFCRRLDDVVDGSPQSAIGGRKEGLEYARRVVGSLYGRGEVELNGPWSEAELAALRETIETFAIPERPFQDLISGMEMDLVQSRYASFAQLDAYCYRVAGVVGLMLAPVLGCRSEAALEAAADLGRAMQLTNILRDVREDLERGRVYLPQDELAQYGLTEADLESGRVDARFVAFMQAQIARARAYYVQAASGIPALGAFGAQRMVRLMTAIYGDILRAIEARGYDVFSARVFVPGVRKFQLAARTLLTAGRPVSAKTALPAPTQEAA